jgi:tRNA (guanosine-2'-O-)-methyltransferase
VVKSLDSTGLKRLHRSWRQRPAVRLGLILDNVASPFNVGAIVRTAAAYRVDDVWVAGDTPPLDDAKVRKTALGCDRYLAWHRVSHTADAIGAARDDGYAIIALELADGAVPLHELSVMSPTCLVVGHEDRGINPTTLQACDAVVYLPLLGKVGSLNVGTATAIALYELRRQGWSQPPE